MHNMSKGRLSVLNSQVDRTGKPDLKNCSSVEQGIVSHYLSSRRSEDDMGAVQKELLSRIQKSDVHDVFVEAPPFGYERYYKTLLTPQAVVFVADLVRTFNDDVEKMLKQRVLRKTQMDLTGELPDFLPETRDIREGDWTVTTVPKRLQCRHVDLGDVSPSNTEHFFSSLKSSAQGIQTDFDDGHCPTWANQLLGLFNVYQVCHNQIAGLPLIHDAPVLMLRPRAWNMVEHNMIVEGKKVPGPLFDFGLLMYHNAKALLNNDCGPFFYLSKLEGHLEAKLWNRIFVHTQEKLGLPVGTIKACVLIENVLASFEMDEILWELKDHSAGLNCGIWDYSASFVNKFGHRGDFLLPDRNKYVSMDRHFLKSYMQLLVQTCHKRGCHATGGMSAVVLPPGGEEEKQSAQAKACRSKLGEIKEGVDGFMVYDGALVPTMQQLFKKFTSGENQITSHLSTHQILAKDLLTMPSGGVTLEGLQYNIAVGILFIEAWLRGQGHYCYKGQVEDSATAEISRSQVWQWIRHQAPLEETGAIVTLQMVRSLAQNFLLSSCIQAGSFQFSTNAGRQRISMATAIFLDLVAKRDFPEFITTFLDSDPRFQKEHNSSIKFKMNGASKM